MRALDPVHFRSRAPAMADHGAVSTPCLAASQAALDVLRNAGNAVDAAVAAAAVCAVVQPFTSTVGGVGWAAVHDDRSGRTGILEFHGTVPRALDPSRLPVAASGMVDFARLETEGGAALGTLTPGLVAGWEELSRSRGRMPLAAVLEPAIDLAGRGFPISELFEEELANNAERVRRYPEAAAAFLPGGIPLTAGERLTQPALAATLRRVAANGAAEFATGRTARAVAATCARHGGALAADDLADYRPRWHDPLETTFLGRTIRAAPGPFGDVAFLQGLRLLEATGAIGDDPLDPAYLRASIESAHLVHADRLRYLGDGVSAMESARLVGDERVATLLRSMPEGTRPGPPTSGPEEDTITLAVVDRDGLAVHLMQTVGVRFGTCLMAEETGVLLNSSLYFGYPGGTGANCIVPGGKVEQNPCIGITLNSGGKLELVVGSPGGKSRVDTVRQMLINVLAFGMDLQQAVDAPRFIRGADGRSVDIDRRIGILGQLLQQQLAALGYPVSLTDIALGSGQAVGVLPNGVRVAAADWRLEAVALAY